MCSARPVDSDVVPLSISHRICLKEAPHRSPYVHKITIRWELVSARSSCHRPAYPRVQGAGMMHSLQPISLGTQVHGRIVRDMMDEALARQLAASGNAAGFVDCVDNCLRSGVNYRALQHSLQGVFNSSQASSKAFLLDCLCLLLSPPIKHGDAAADKGALQDRPKHNSGLPYLLLDAAPTSATSSQQQQQQPNQQQPGDANSIHAPDATVAAAAVHLMRTCCRNRNLKAALRIAQVFQLSSSDVQQQTGAFDELRDCLAAQLGAGKAGLTSAVGLLMLFQDLATDSGVHVRSLLADLAETGQEGLAERWLTQLGRGEQEAYVEACVAADRLKAACRAVRNFGLRDTFPDVETVYRSRAFARLLDRQLWPLAAQFAGSDRALQEQLVTVLAEHDPQHAQELGAQWELPPAVMARLLDPGTRAAAEAARAAKYYGFALPQEAILLVDDRASIATAHQLLSSASLVGIDVEWKPEGASRASLLQIATEERVFLFDLFSLLNPDQSHMSEQQQEPQEGPGVVQALDACLTAVLQNKACLKLGLEVHGDIRKLHGSWPLAAFSNVGPLLDLKDLWVAYLSASNPHVSQLRRSAGLSTLCQELLGKPLDKSMQVSDWERRPLTTRQVIYAAQDAHVLTTLYQRLYSSTPNAATAAACKCFNVQAGNMQVPQGGSSNITFRAGKASAAAQAPAVLHDSCDNAHMTTAGGISSDFTTTSNSSQQQAVLACLSEAGLLDCLIRVPQVASAGPGIATAVAAATALDIPITQVAKSVALMTASGGISRQSSRPCLVVMRGDQRLDMHKVAVVLGVARKAVRIATTQECLDLFGYLPGCLPPFGLPAGVRVIIDSDVINSKQDATCQQSHLSCDVSSTVDMMDSSVADQTTGSSCQLCHRSVHDSGNNAASSTVNMMVDSLAAESPAQLCVARNDCTVLDSSSNAGLFRESTASGHNKSMSSSVLLYTGAGSNDAVVALTGSQLLQLSRATVADLSQPAGAAAEPASQGSVQAHADAGLYSPMPNPSRHALNPATASQREPAFLLDTMLGRLCRYLRLCGVDAEIIEQPLPRPEMVKRANASGRVFLTRDMGLAVRRDAPPLTYLLRDDDPASQLRDVAEQWSLTCNLEERIMSRCNTCNAAAFVLMDPSAAQPLVPPKVFQVVQEFFQCGNCKKVFWEGPKSYAAKNRLESLLAGDRQQSVVANSASCSAQHSDCAGSGDCPG